jgi:hypothetical protein
MTSAALPNAVRREYDRPRQLNRPRRLSYDQERLDTALICQQMTQWATRTSQGHENANTDSAGRGDDLHRR